MKSGYVKKHRHIIIIRPWWKKKQFIQKFFRSFYFPCWNIKLLISFIYLVLMKIFTLSRMLSLHRSCRHGCFLTRDGPKAFWLGGGTKNLPSGIILPSGIHPLFVMFKYIGTSSTWAYVYQNIEGGGSNLSQFSQNKSNKFLFCRC